eukprot:ctg_281.g170
MSPRNALYFDLVRDAFAGVLAGVETATAAPVAAVADAVTGAAGGAISQAGAGGAVAVRVHQAAHGGRGHRAEPTRLVRAAEDAGRAAVLAIRISVHLVGGECERVRCALLDGDAVLGHGGPATALSAAAQVLVHQWRWITDVGDYSSDSVATGVQDLLICAEMAMAAVAHHFVFSWKEFEDYAPDPSRPLLRNFGDIVDIRDVLSDAKDALYGTGFDRELREGEPMAPDWDGLVFEADGAPGGKAALRRGEGWRAPVDGR